MSLSLWIEAATRTNRGQVWEGNTDAVYLERADSWDARTHGVLCIVAGGRPGSTANALASHRAIQGVRDGYYASARASMVDALRSALEAASATAGSLTAAVVRGSDVVVGQIGDARAYLVRDSGVVQITQDQASTVDIRQHTLVDRDVVLLCSEGLTALVSDEEMARSASVSSPDQTVTYLVALARQRGAADNVTVAALQIHGPEPGTRLARLRASAVWPPVAALAVALTLAGVLAFIVVNQTAQPIDAAPVATDVPTDTIMTVPPPAVATSAPAPASVTSGEIAYVSSTANLRSTLDLSAGQTNVSGRLMQGQAVVIDGTQTNGPIPDGEAISIWYHVHLPTPDALSGWLWAGSVRRGAASPAPVAPGP